MGGSSSSLQVSNSILNSSATNAIMTTQDGCFSKVQSVQDITITGDSPGYPTVNDNSAICVYCLETIRQIGVERQKLEADAAARDKHYVPQSANSELVAAVASGGDIEGLGPCTLMCKDQVVTKISQDAVFEAKATCNFKTTAKTEIKDKLQASVDQSLKNEQDVLGQLGSLLSSNSDSVSSNISNRFVKNVSQELVEELHASASEVQSVLVGDSNSVFVSGVKQSYTGKQDSTLKAVSDFTNQLQSSAQISVAQALSHKNATTNDILDSVSDSFQNATQLFSDTVGGVISIIAALLVTGLLLFAIYYAYNPKFRQMIHRRIEEND